MVEHVLKNAPSLHDRANDAGRTPQHLAAFLRSPVRQDYLCIT